MSFDFRLAHECPHLILEESITLSDDRRSLISKAPVGNTTLLRVIANNEFYVPYSGLYSQAFLVGSASGPFRITGCVSSNGTELSENNVLTVTGSNEAVTFRLPIGTRITTDALVTFMQRNLSTILVENDGGHLAFTDMASVGSASRIKLTGRGREPLGFEMQYAANGKEVYPPWGLVNQEDVLPLVNRNGLVVTTARYVQFSKPIRGNPTLKVTYVSPPERCPRCSGTSIENDWRFNVEGDLVTVDNENLLYQACMKMLLTVRGSNAFHTAYGSTIMTRIGTKALGATATLLQEDVRTALVRVQSLQQQQARVQQVSLKERLYSILSVEVLPHKSDPTAFLIDVMVSNGTGEPVQLTIVFAVPGAIALAGSNNLSLGLNT